MIEKSNKTEVVRFRCTSEQKALIEKMAASYEKNVSEYLVMLVNRDSYEEKPEQMLKRIGLRDYNGIESCELLYKNAVEKAYKVDTGIGEVCFRIVNLPTGTVSILDYIETGMETHFDRNINFPEKY